MLSHEKEKALALTILKLPDAVEALVQVFWRSLSPYFATDELKFLRTPIGRAAFAPVSFLGFDNRDLPPFLPCPGASSVAAMRLHVQPVRHLQRVLQLVQGAGTSLVTCAPCQPFPFLSCVWCVASI